VIAGCSTAGEIPRRDRFAIAASRSSITLFARTDVRLAVEPIAPDDGFGTGSAAGDVRSRGTPRSAP